MGKSKSKPVNVGYTICLYDVDGIFHADIFDETTPSRMQTKVTENSIGEALITIASCIIIRENQKLIKKSEWVDVTK